MALNYTSDKLKHLKMFYDILNLVFFFFGGDLYNFLALVPHPSTLNAYKGKQCLPEGHSQRTASYLKPQEQEMALSQRKKQQVENTQPVLHRA